jgi:DNA polymerase-3 subunit beta
MAIAFNARFLIEMLSATSSDEVKMELSTPTKAGIIKPVEQDDEEDLLMLVMPLMLNQ